MLQVCQENIRMERDSYINLFKKINENLKARNYQDATTDSFNVFKVLGIEYREIYICRLLGAILDPDGAQIVFKADWMG